MKGRLPVIVIICFAMVLSVASCKRTPGKVVEPKKITIVTTLFPIYDFTKKIAGDKAQVILLLPPGIEAHSFEPKPGDMVRINGADLFIYTGKFMEPWVERILKGVDNKKLLVIDASQGIDLLESDDEDGDHRRADSGRARQEGHAHQHGRYDPHIWLDFSRAQKMTGNILSGLVRQDPANKGFYEQNGTAYEKSLQELDNRFKSGLTQCGKDTFVHGGHFAFNYLAKRYNLRYISAYEGSPNAEPSPRRIVELKRQIEGRKIRYVYYEELIMPRVADILAQETGAGLLKLNGAHNISKDDLLQGKSFIGLMDENLNNLRQGLECR